jgi:hypothetical protein
LSNPIIDWSLASYVIGASLLTITIGTSYLAYTGTITPASIYNGVKVIGTSLWSLISYFGFDSDDSNKPKDPGNSGNIWPLGRGGASAEPSAIRPSVVGEVEVDEVVIKEAWLKTLARDDRGKAREALSPLAIGSTKPAAINVGLGDKTDLPLSSATGHWSRVSAAYKPSSGPLIEVNPSSPTGSDAGSVSSDKTVMASVETQDSSTSGGGWVYPNLVIYPPINNNTNNDEPLQLPYAASGILLLESMPMEPEALILPVKDSTYPDSNLGCWQDTYIKYSKGVGDPELYEEIVKLNKRLPNLTKEEVEVAWIKIRSKDKSIYVDYPSLRS